jgi:serine/threonine protein kinase
MNQTLTTCAYCLAPVPPHATSCGSCGMPLAAGLHLKAGTVVGAGRYRLDATLGRGGFGLTYKGFDRQDNRVVAIKELFLDGSVRRELQVIPPASLRPQDFDAARASFLNEARTMARFSHSSIVGVLDTFEDNNTAYMVMEFVEGESLGDRLIRSKTLAPAEVERIGVAVAEGLAIVHNANLLHRDIKPDNILLRNDGRVILIDFGSARDFSLGQQVQHTRLVTPGYAPLEQYQSQGRFGPYTDIYALGATLYHALTGTLPASSLDRAALSVSRGNKATLESPRVLQPNMSVTLEQAILWALEIRVDARPQTAALFQEALLGGVKPRAKNTPKPLAVNVPISTPNLDLAKQKLLLLEESLKAVSGVWICPSCRTGQMLEVKPSENCPVCQKPSMKFPDAAQKPCCPDCHQSSLEVIVTTAYSRAESAFLQQLGLSVTEVAPSQHLHCPACEKGELKPPKPVNSLICPACRGRTLENRVPNRRLCPHCRTGNLEAFKTDQACCPNCKVGRITQTSKRKFVFILEHRANCDHCDATWDTQHPHWKLLNATGELADQIGSSYTPETWESMSERGRSGMVCNHCHSEFDQQNDGRLKFAYSLEKTPLLSKTMTVLEWAKLAHRIAPHRGTQHCQDCSSEFDLDAGNMTLLSSPLLRDQIGQTQPLEAWKRLASGKRSIQDGVLCEHCNAEWDWVSTVNPGERQLKLVHVGRSQSKLPVGMTISTNHGALKKAGKNTGLEGMVCKNCASEWDETAPKVFTQTRVRGAKMLASIPSMGIERLIALGKSRSMGRKTASVPGPTCGSCASEWIVQGQNWDAVTSSQSPWNSHGQSWELVSSFKASLVGMQLPSEAWGYLAAGKQHANAGVKCSTCATELDLTNQLYTLGNQSLSKDDWMRFAAGKPLSSDGTQFKLEGESALLKAIEHAEWQQANTGFPRNLGLSEKVLFVLEAQLGKKEGNEYVPGNFGKVWFTTQRLVFEGNTLQKDVEILINKLDQLNVAAQSIQTPGSQTETLYRIWTERTDRKRPIILFSRSLNVSLTSGTAKLEVQIRANQLEKLLSHLKSNSVNP